MVLSLTPLRRRGISSLTTFVVLLLVCGLAAGGYYYWRSSNDDALVREDQLILGTVEKGPFDHIVLEQGEVESSSNTEILCQVKSRNGGGVAILWVIDEGTRVEKGEKLVELDSSQLETELKQQKIIVNNAKASLTSAEALLQQAKIAREEYLEGIFKTDEKTLESEIAVAQQELKRAQLSLNSTEKMVAKGLVNSLQMEGDQFGVVNAQNQLDSATARLKVLRDLTKQKMLVQYDSDIEAAVASREAARSTLIEEEEKLQDIETQIKACVMYAPSAGVVVHGNKYSSRGGNAEFVVEPGAVVRERQSLIRLPDPTKMQVMAKINESRITLVREGMPAKIRVDAVEGMELLGRVRKVNRYAEPGSWFSSSTKEYACAVEIVNPPDNIRTGMTAEVRIFVEQLTDAVQIPIQGVYEHLGRTFTLVRTPSSKFETREIVIGATNDTMATIKSGVEPGEKIVLNLRSHLDQMDLPEPDEAVDSETLTEQLAAQGIKTEIADGPSVSVKETERPAGGPGGGGAPSAADMVQRSFDQYDADKDGFLSTEEIAGMPERSQASATEADTDGDGKISRSELTVAMAKVVARIRAAMSSNGGGPAEGGFGG
jgi:multidrug efflux pump subunit AcrA (membrane-fusion protein)